MQPGGSRKEEGESGRHAPRAAYSCRDINSRPQEELSPATMPHGEHGTISWRSCMRCRHATTAPSTRLALGVCIAGVPRARSSPHVRAPSATGVQSLRASAPPLQPRCRPPTTTLSTTRPGPTITSRARSRMTDDPPPSASRLRRHCGSKGRQA